MIQLIDLMILFVGCYVITRMSVYVFQDDIKMGGLGIFITKSMAIVTIVITAICTVLAILSFIGTLDLGTLERYLELK